MRTKVLQYGAQVALITWAKANMIGEVHFYYGVGQIKMLEEDHAHSLIVMVENFCMQEGITIKSL